MTAGARDFLARTKREELLCFRLFVDSADRNPPRRRPRSSKKRGSAPPALLRRSNSSASYLRRSRESCRCAGGGSTAAAACDDAERAIAFRHGFSSSSTVVVGLPTCRCNCFIMIHTFFISYYRAIIIHSVTAAAWAAGKEFDILRCTVRSTRRATAVRRLGDR